MMSSVPAKQATTKPTPKKLSRHTGYKATEFLLASVEDDALLCLCTQGLKGGQTPTVSIDAGTQASFLQLVAQAWQYRKIVCHAAGGATRLQSSLAPVYQCNRYNTLGFCCETATQPLVACRMLTW